MARILIPLLILVAAGAAWFLFVHDDATPPANRGELDTPANPAPEDAKSGPPTDKSGSLQAPAKKVKKADPKPEFAKLRVAASALLVAQMPGQWPSLMELVLGGTGDLAYRTWYLEKPGEKGGKPGKGRELPELADRPTGAYLEDNDIRALLLDGVDPNAFPASFWEVVARRVHSGSMGLWFRAGWSATGQRANTQNPALTHPVLSQLLPIAKALPIEGVRQPDGTQSVPGVYDEPQRLVIAPAGTRHPATRLVDDPAASERVWSTVAQTPGVFATNFCYPVLQIKPGAQTLVNVDAATSVPAIVVSSRDVGRVLWMGNVDFGTKTHYDTKANGLQQMVINHELVWLLGQAENG